jgi:hypothetical protein
VAVLASTGWLMASLGPTLVASILAVVVAWAVLLDWFKVRLFGRLGLHAA